MTNTTHRPAHIRRIGLAALCVVLAYIGFASAAKTAGAATPVIVNNGAVADRAAQKAWLSSTIVGGETGNNSNQVRVSLFIQHDIGRKVTGLRIDEDYNGTDSSNTATLRPVTAQQPVTIGGYQYSRVDYTYNNSTSGLSSWSCSLFSQTFAQNRNIYLRAQLDNGEQTASSVSDLRFHKANGCSNPITGSFQPYTHSQSQSSTSVAPGGSVNFSVSLYNAATAALSTAATGVRWRLRNSMTGAVTGTTESGGSFSVTFPTRGHWVVEGKPWGSPLLGGTTERNEWMYIGEVDVNGDPTATLTATRPVLNGTTSINATNVSDPDSANGGLIQDVLWDLDFNTGNGVDGFEQETLGTYTTSPTGAGLYSKSIDTTGMSPGWYQVRMKLRDNGAYSGADNSAGDPIFSDQFLVNSIPVANDDNSSHLESDETIGITLPTSDSDVFPAESIDDDSNLDITIIDQPDNGTVSTPNGKDVVYDPDNDFSGYDTFTYESDDGWGGTDTGEITVRVDPATDWEDVPNPAIDIDARGVSPEFSSPTEGSTFVKFECSLDYAAWYDCESGEEISDLDDGLHHLKVRTYGGAGTVDPTPVETEWVIDATPTVTFTDTPTPDSGDESPSFEFDVDLPGNTAPIDTRCKVEGPDQSGEFQPCASPFALTDLNDGQYKLTVKATDQYGKTSSSSYSWEIAVGGVHTWIVDNPPAFSASADAEFTFESTDPLNTFECSLDGAAWASCTSPVELLNLGDGEHTFEVRAVSPVNVADTTPASWQFTVDTTAPTTTVNGTVPARTNQPIALNFGSNENDATFQCSIDGGDFAPCATPYVSPILSDGPHTLEVAAVDRAGNVDPAPVSRNWIVDTIAPTTSIDSGPAAGSLVNTSAANFGFTSSETSTVQCKMDGQSWRDCSSNTAESYAGLADGDHTFHVRSTDLAGNVEAAPVSRSWSIDTKAPVVGIDDGPAGTVKSSAAKFKFSSSETGVTFECKVDGGSFAPCSSPNDVTGLADGDHTFSVRAIDAAGNGSEHPAKRNWTVDTSTVKPPDKKPDPTPETECTLKSTEAKCSAPVVTAAMKKIGKKPGKNSSVALGLDAGKTPLSGATFALNSRATLTLSKKAKGKKIGQVVLRSADGSTRSVRLAVPRSTKPGARGRVTLSGPADFKAVLKRGKAPSVAISGLPEKVTGISVGLKGKGLTVRSKGCATQRVVSALADRDGNTARASAFVDPPCRLKKTKGAR